MEGDEILHVSAIVHEPLIAEPVDDLRAHAGCVTLVEELTTQVGGAPIASRQRVERRHTGGARVVGVYRPAPRVTPP